MDNSLFEPQALFHHSETRLCMTVWSRSLGCGLILQDVIQECGEGGFIVYLKSKVLEGFTENSTAAFPWKRKTSRFTAKSLRAAGRVVVCLFVFISEPFPDSTLSSFRIARRSRRQRIPTNTPKWSAFLWVSVCVGERKRVCVCVVCN